MKFKVFTIQAVAIEREDPEVNVPCGACSKCCTDLSPILTPEEFMTGKYIYTLITSPIDNKPTIAIPRNENGCIYYINKKCSIYNDRPLACRQFDCRKGHYPKFKELALEKFGEYSEY